VPARDRGHRRAKLNGAAGGRLGGAHRAHPDLTLAALQSWLLAEHGFGLSNGAMWRRSSASGCHFKKRHCAPPSRTVRMSQPRARIWRAAQPFVDPDKLVFIDGTAATTKDDPALRSRAARPAPVGQGAVRSLEDHHLYRRAARAMASARRWCSTAR